MTVIFTSYHDFDITVILWPRFPNSNVLKIVIFNDRLYFLPNYLLVIAITYSAFSYRYGVILRGCLSGSQSIDTQFSSYNYGVILTITNRYVMLVAIATF